MLKVHKSSKGFTLIELLIVIAIIGILAAIALPAYLDYAKKARLTEAFNTIGAVKTGIVAYSTERSEGSNFGTITGIDNVQNMSGVTIPRKYIQNMSVTGDGTNTSINTTLNSIDETQINGRYLYLNSNDPNLQRWRWEPGNLVDKFMPKN